MGRIYLFRTAPKGPGIPPRIVIDNYAYDELWPGHSYHLDVQPGVHRIRTDMSGNDELEVNVGKGENVIVKYVLDPKIFGKGFYPVLMDYSEGAPELKEYTGTSVDCKR
ncbi:conserved hypothetical protein [Ricinus communis]|uniref:DUF2846 domain-containing protein n=1 Tax=Ricinus communis TaxID=3988 RepID=B9T9D8_RICCO|nr:conserved hypothetical protein [Ricinus communis]